MKLFEALFRAASSTVNPTFSLFGVSSTGRYTLITRHEVSTLNGPLRRKEIENHCTLMVEQFKKQCVEYRFAGLEVRVDGVAVQFNSM